MTNKFPYQTFGRFLINKFGKKLHKLPLHTYQSCPHKTKGGCTFCSNFSFSDLSIKRDTISRQLEEGIKVRRNKGYQGGFIAYFQTETPTVAKASEFKGWLNEIEHFQDDIKALSIATRPDTLTQEHLKIISSFSMPVWLEIGLQSVHDKTLSRINRGHDYSSFLQAYEMVRKYPEILTVIHLIIGLPGENLPMMKETIQEVNRLHVHGIKIHHLQVIKGTKLAKEYKSGKISILSEEEYFALLVKLIPLIDKNIILHRLTGDADSNLLIAPLWQNPKPVFLSRLQNYLTENNIFQGCRLI